MYSNQGSTGLCTMHAVGKATLQQWKMCLGERHPMDLRSMISYLATVKQKGVKGSTVPEYDGLKGQILSPDC